MMNAPRMQRQHLLHIVKRAERKDLEKERSLQSQRKKNPMRHVVTVEKPVIKHLIAGPKEEARKGRV